MDRDKFRIRFRKSGDLRLLSHHDLMRAFERMLRRAALPFRSTEGFHPHPRLVFALSLPLGVAGLQEVVELELNEPIPPDDVLSRLAAQAPDGLEFLSIRRIPSNVTAQVCRAIYRVPVPPERVPQLTESCAQLLARSECPVERSRPQPRRVDIRPYLLDLRVAEGTLEIELRVTPTGAARADEVLALLGLTDLLDAGAVVERAVLELEDEIPPSRFLPSVASCSSPPLSTSEANGALQTTDYRKRTTV